MIFKKRIIISLLLIFSFSNFLFSQIDEPVKWSFSTEKIDETYSNLIINATIDDGWHLYSQYFDFGGPMPLYFEFNENGNFKIIDSVVESPQPISEFDATFEVNVKYFKKHAKFVQRIEVLTKEGFNIEGIVEGQACSSACIPLSSDMVFKINGGAETEKISESSIKSSDASTPKIVSENKFVDKSSKESSFIYFFFISFLFGIVGVLTPCVFPMIPMTISFFMQSGANKFNGILKALIFGISIMLLYTLLGVIVSLTSAGADLTTTLSTHWIPNLVFFVLFMIFAASLFGVFEIVLPSGLANKADKQVDKGGLMAAFFMALTTVIVSFSCTGPIIGALLVQAAGGNVLEPTIGMLGFGLGFALPFTILAISPHWLSKLPKSGGWLNSVKVVMGFVILAFSLKYFSNIDQNYHLGILSRDVYLAIWIVIFLLMGMYLLGKIRFSHDSEAGKLGFFRMLLAMSSFVFVIYLVPGLFGANLTSIAGLLPPKSTQNFDLSYNPNSGDSNNLCDAPKYSDVLHNPYNVNGYFDYKQGIECAKSQNKPVLLYFTGHACANCKKMQASIWSDNTINEYLNNEVILTSLYVDEKSITLDENEIFVSSNDGKTKKKLGEANADLQVVNFGVNSQPYYVLMSPDGKVLTEAMTYNDSPEKFLEFLKKGLEEFEK